MGAGAGVGLRRTEEREGVFFVCLGALCLLPKSEGRREKMLEVDVDVDVAAGVLVDVLPAVLVGW
jgi:hypothetical protein